MRHKCWLKKYKKKNIWKQFTSACKQLNITPEEELFEHIEHVVFGFKRGARENKLKTFTRQFIPFRFYIVINHLKRPQFFRVNKHGMPVRTSKKHKEVCIPALSMETWGPFVKREGGEKRK